MSKPQRSGSRFNGRATVIGAGPNGLAAAIVLARAGVQVDVCEAEPTIGGGARTLELTIPGFRHDFGSAIHPLAAASPFFSTLPLEKYGLAWIHSPLALAHPLDDGTAVVLERGLGKSTSTLGVDARAWDALTLPVATHWHELAPDLLGPIVRIPRHPLQLARFGISAVLSARMVASRFRLARTRALFAGLAAHSFLALDEPLTAAFGMMLAITARAVGWPFPRGGAQSIADALAAHLTSLGGAIHTNVRVENLEALGENDLAICDVAPRDLARIAGDRLSPRFSRLLTRFRQGPGAFKVDYALDGPIPWTATECALAATVHLGGSFEEIAESEAAMRDGRIANKPFVLVAQPSLFDATRAPAGRQTAWAYMHVPNGSTVDVLALLEAQIERFAPGFRERILARRIFAPADLQAMDANLIGGDIGGGAVDALQFVFRPTWRQYATSNDRIYLCSASTPPGGGVHGMCGYHAATLALSRLG
jgi:phytoene dehydrogenase-like protein